MQASGDSGFFALLPNRIEIRMREASPADIFGREENSLEAQLDASLELGQRRIDVLQRDMRNWNHAAAYRAREIVDPVVVCARICARELAVDDIPENSNRRKQHARVHAPLIQQLDPLRGQITRGRASVEVTQLARNEELLTRLIGATKSRQHSLEQRLIVDHQDF